MVKKAVQVKAKHPENLTFEKFFFRKKSIPKINAVGTIKIPAYRTDINMKPRKAKHEKDFFEKSGFLFNA